MTMSSMLRSQEPKELRKLRAANRHVAQHIKALSLLAPDPVIVGRVRSEPFLLVCYARSLIAFSTAVPSSKNVGKTRSQSSIR